MMMMALALLVIGCGKNAKEADGNANEKLETGTETKAAPTASNTDRKSDEYIISRVLSIYADVFAEYNKAAEDESVPPHSPDEKYCSDDWNKALLEVTEYDQQNNPDDIGFFDADYWVMGQDFGDLSVSDVEILEHKGNEAKVKFNLHNFGQVSPIQLDLRFERGDWFIDDFYEIEHGFDWKKEMRDYMK